MAVIGSFCLKQQGGRGRKGPSNSHYQNPSSIDPSAGFHSIRAVDERAWVSQTSFWGVGCGFMTCFFTYYITREKIFTSFQVSYVTYIQYVFPIHHYHSSFIHHHQKKKKKGSYIVFSQAYLTLFFLLSLHLCLSLFLSTMKERKNITILLIISESLTTRGCQILIE